MHCNRKKACKTNNLQGHKIQAFGLAGLIVGLYRLGWLAGWAGLPFTQKQGGGVPPRRTLPRPSVLFKLSKPHLPAPTYLHPPAPFLCCSCKTAFQFFRRIPSCSKFVPLHMYSCAFLCLFKISRAPLIHFLYKTAIFYPLLKYHLKCMIYLVV